MKHLFVRLVNVGFVKVTREQEKDKSKITEGNNGTFSLTWLHETRVV